MTGYLLDTNIISEYGRPAPPDVRVKTWVDAQDENALHLSALTLGEIRKGTVLLSAGSKRAQLQRWLEIELATRFAGRILPINAEIAEIWGAMAGEAQLKGVAMAIIDGLIAATARHHDLTLVTRNVRDFRMWTIPVLNPWEPV